VHLTTAHPAIPLAPPYLEMMVAPQPPDSLFAGSTPPAPGQLARSAGRSRLRVLPLLRLVPLLARPVAQATPWGAVLAGCLAGLVYLAILAHFADAAGSPLDYGSVRLAFLPAATALAFALRAPFRPLTQVTPLPAWLAPVGQLLLAAPVLAVTCWGELRIVAYTVPPHVIGYRLPVYLLIAQLTGWCAVTVAAAAWVSRSRYADLGGAVAAPVSLAAIALAWYTPGISRVFLTPPASVHAAAIAWYASALAGSALTCAAMRDQWHRYARGLPFGRCCTFL
jgi:hypothetical protein